MSEYSNNIWKLYLFRFFASLHFFSGVLVPFFLDWGEITFFQIMVLQMIFSIGIVLFEIPTGAIADRWGRKNSLVLGAVFLILAVLTYSYKPAFILFMIAELFWAISASLISGSEEALAYDSLKSMNDEKRSKKVYVNLNIVMMSSIVIAAPIGSIIAKYFGLRETVLFMAIPFVFALVIALGMKETNSLKKEKRHLIKDIQISFNYFKDHKILRILTFDKVTIGMLCFMVVWLYQPILMDNNIDIVNFGWIHAIMTAAQIPILFNIEWFEKKLKSKRRYLFISAIIPGIAFILLGIMDSLIAIIILISLISGIGISRETLFQSYMNKFIESENRATVLSTISMIRRLAISIVYMIVGLLMKWSLPYTLIILGISIIIASMISEVKEEHLID